MKKTYIIPLLKTKSFMTETTILEGSVQGFDNNPGWNEGGEDDGGDPRSKERGFDDFGSLW